MDNGIVVFCNDTVGLKTIEFLAANYPQDLSGVVVSQNSSTITTFLKDSNFEKPVFYYKNKESEKDLLEFLNSLGAVDYILLAWWPYIIKGELFDVPKIGILNFHPSLLPYNRGKHYSFWNIVEDVPFGVTIHFVDAGIDTGDIVFQKEIEKDWEDTGKTLYDKAQIASTQLFEESYPKLRINNYERRPQDLSQGSFHYGKEIEEKSRLNLDDMVKTGDLINLLRARSFPPHPGCFFYADGKKYELRLSVKEVQN